MEDVGPQSGEQSADLMDYMESDTPLDDTATEAPESSAQDSDDESDTPEGAQTTDGHARDGADDELDDDEQPATPQADGDATQQPSWAPTSPFTYQLGHETFDLGDNAVVGADGTLFIAKEAVPEVQRLISRGRYHDTVYPRERQQMEARIRAAETRYDENATKVKGTLGFLDNLIAQGPDQVLKFLQNWEINKPQLMAAQERAMAQELYQRAQQAQQGDPAEIQYRQQEQKTGAIRNIVDNGKRDPQYAFMGPQDWDRFAQRLNRNQSQLFTVADRDYSMDQTTNGIAIRKGDVALNVQYLNEELSEFAGYVQQAGQRTQAVNDAAAKNAKLKGQPGKTNNQLGARTQTRNGNPGAAKQKGPKNWREWRDGLMENMGIVNAGAE